MSTLHNVALAAGVSDSTVSRALRGMDTVRPKTRQRVAEAAKQLGFTLTRSASSLASGKTMRVVILFDGPVNAWFNANCLQGALEVLAPEGYDLVPVIAMTRPELEDFFAKLPGSGNNMDGLILPSFLLEDSYSQALTSLHIPAVALDTSSTTQLPASIVLDNKGAMYDAVRFLHGLGHRRIGYVEHPSPAPFESSSHLRERYFLEAAKRMGYADGDVTVFPKQSLVERMPIDEATAEITGRIVSAPNRPTAICVEIDEAAFDIMQRLRALGIRVPQDMSVVGFDDHEAAALADLTTIHQDPQLMARAAAQKLLTMMRGGTLDEPSTTFRTTLIPRGSTAPPSQDRP